MSFIYTIRKYYRLFVENTIKIQGIGRPLEPDKFFSEQFFRTTSLTLSLQLVLKMQAEALSSTADAKLAINENGGPFEHNHSIKQQINNISKTTTFFYSTNIAKENFKHSSLLALVPFFTTDTFAYFSE